MIIIYIFERLKIDMHKDIDRIFAFVVTNNRFNTCLADTSRRTAQNARTPVDKFTQPRASCLDKLSRGMTETL